MASIDLKLYHRYRHVSKKHLKYGTKKGSGPALLKKCGVSLCATICGFLSNLDYFPCNDTINFNEIDTGLDVCKTGWKRQDIQDIIIR
jgi:hypothetical protein